MSQASARQTALAIENARLRSEAEQCLSEIQRRQEVAEALRDLMAHLATWPGQGPVL